MMEEGLTPSGMKSEERICLNTKEAADFVKRCIKITESVTGDAK